MVLILAAAALPGLALSEGGEVALYVVQAHGLVTAFMILLILQYRVHVRSQQQHDTTLALERSQLQAQHERDIREEQDKLLAMLAHELKTPLATMHMRLDGNAPGSREIKHAIRDMNGVIERCLQTAQLGDRQLVAHLEPLDLVSVLRDAVLSCAQPNRVQLSTPAALQLSSDRQLLFIVLNNLLENACKYAPADTPIEVVLTSTPHADGATHMAQLEIANQTDPTGWPEVSQIFQKYYRSPHARRQAGTGLGLFLVRNLVLTLGGNIEYAPDAHHVRFVIELPTAAKNI